MQKIFFFIIFSISIIWVLVLNGNIQATKKPLPPMGKFLNPFGGAWTSDSRNETGDIILQDPNLKSTVEIRYDERRVPHIFAQNMEDALFAQGYVEAQNRLFQMEFLTLAASGQLSSVIGDATIEIDLEKRYRGMMYAAEKGVKGWEKSKDIYSTYRYVDGVNAYIKSLDPKNYPIEFKLFDIHPEEWSALKCALVFKQMSLTLAGRNSDIVNTNLILQLGKEEFDMLYPERQTIENPVIPTEKPFAFDSIYGSKQNTDATYKTPILKTYYEEPKKGIGSNAWAVSGSKTSTGKPIFCNDPHLSLGLPSIWFEIHIHTPEFNAYGVSFPGMPGIMIGFNDYIAWGETNVGQDVEDMFVIDWANKEKTKYWIDGKEEEVAYRIEEIKVKGGKTIIDTVKYTYWGPIYKTSNDGKHDLAMRWICHDEPDKAEYNVFINAMLAKNYNEYLQATEPYISPAQNFNFAAKDGDIALRVNGRFPAKFDQDGRFVEKGNASQNNWNAWIPRNQNPQIINPQRGFIASANQVSADKTYPYYFNGKFERYRNRSVNDKLEKMTNISIADMQKMQQDAFSFKAKDYMDFIISRNLIDKLSDKEKNIFKILEDWDFIYTANSEAPTFFDMISNRLTTNTWDEIDGFRKTLFVQYPEDWRLLELMVNDPTNKYFDIVSTTKTENVDDILLISLKEAMAEFVKRKEENKGNQWRQYKPLNIFHMTRVPAFSTMDVKVGGCPDVINACGVEFGPSWRMVVSLEDKTEAYGVYPGGQSGNPTSKFYKNMIDTWAKGEYFDLNPTNSIDQLKDKTTQSLTFSPKK